MKSPMELPMDCYMWLMRPERVTSGPRVLHLETTTRCNLTCIICPRTSALKHPANQDGDRSHGDLSLVQFCQLLSECGRVRRFRFHGLGEPLLNPDLVAMVSEAKRRGVETEFTTNATLLSPEIGKELIRAGLSCLTISLDGATASTYETIRVGARFNSVIDNVRQLTETKRQMGSRHPILSVNMVVTRQNLSELPGILKLSREIGAVEFRASPLEPTEDTMVGWLPDPLAWRQVACSAKKLAKHVGIAFEDHGASRWTGGPSAAQAAARLCHRPWQTLYVRLNGYITPCCNISDPHVLGEQNAFDAGLDSIWNSSQLRQFRNQLKRGPIPPNCLKCSSM